MGQGRDDKAKKEEGRGRRENRPRPLMRTKRRGGASP